MSFHLTQVNATDLKNCIEDTGMEGVRFDRIELSLRTFGVIFYILLAPIPATPETTIVSGKNISDRFQVPNIIDRRYLGPARTMAAMSPLLNNSEENPHTTVIGLIMNAIKESTYIGEEGVLCHQEMPNLFFSHRTGYARCRNQQHTSLLAVHQKVKGCCTKFRDYDMLFVRYLKCFKIERITREANLETKEHYTIVGKWPMGLYGTLWHLPKMKSIDWH